MLINGDVLWCDSRIRSASPIVFGGMDHLTDIPSCNVQNDIVTARLLQFNLEPGSLALDEMIFHFYTLQVLMPSICWCPPAVWVINESQFRFPNQPADLQMCFQHFVVPILVVFDWIFVEVRLFEGEWRVLYHSPEQLTLRQRTAVLELMSWVCKCFPMAFVGSVPLKTQDLLPGILSGLFMLELVRHCFQPRIAPLSGCKGFSIASV